MNNFSGICPVCGGKMTITKLHCHNCNTSLEGNFVVPKMSALSEEQQAFVELFVKCRGNLKEVGKELALSYPTVRNRLDEVIIAFGYSIKDNYAEEQKIESQKLSVLDSIENGELSVEEALERLNSLTHKKTV